MKQLTCLVWKEWHETRVFLWIGLGIFLGLPCIAGLEDTFQYSHQFQLITWPWVNYLGGVFAVFVAIGATSRDLPDHLQDFWRSRPVSAVRWFAVKYLVGLTIVLCACVSPMLVEQWRGAKDIAPITFVIWMPFLWIALYSLAFAAGCLIKRAAHAAMIALAGMLLIYFLPMALPPLRAMNVSEVFEPSYRIVKESFRPGMPMMQSWWSRHDISFAISMTSIACAALVLSLLSVRYRWRIEAGQRMMYGAISTALLIIVATMGYKLGTNLPILQEARLPAGETISLIRMEGNHGFVFTYQSSGKVGIDAENWIYRLRPIEVTSLGFQLGEPAEIGQSPFYGGWWPENISPPGHPEIDYRLSVGIPVEDRTEEVIRLVIRNIAKPLDDDSGIGLWTQSSNAGWPSIHIWNGRLYVIGDRVALFDISNPLKLQLISNEPFSFRFAGYEQTAQTFSISLPPVPGLPNEERLKAAVLRGNNWWRLEDGILCQINGSGYNSAHPKTEIVAWRLQNLTDKRATFELVDQYKQTVLEQIFGSLNGLLTTGDGLMYLTSNTSSMANGGVTVFDLRSKHPLEAAGHFGAPGIRTVCPLSDGRVLVGGSRLWLVGPPPGRK